MKTLFINLLLCSLCSCTIVTKNGVMFVGTDAKRVKYENGQTQTKLEVDDMNHSVAVKETAGVVKTGIGWHYGSKIVDTLTQGGVSTTNTAAKETTKQASIKSNETIKLQEIKSNETLGLEALKAE